MLCFTFLRSNSTNHIRSIFDRLFGVKRCIFSGYSLTDHACAFVDEHRQRGGGWEVAAVFGGDWWEEFCYAVGSHRVWFEDSFWSEKVRECDLKKNLDFLMMSVWRMMKIWRRGWALKKIWVLKKNYVSIILFIINYLAFLFLF